MRFGWLLPILLLDSGHTHVHASEGTITPDASTAEPILPYSSLVRRADNTKEWIKTLAPLGRCLSFYGNGPDDVVRAPCLDWCPKQHPNLEDKSVGCMGPDVPKDMMDPTQVFTDEEGREWTPGECICGLQGGAKLFADPIIEGLGMLDEVICKVFVEAAMAVVDIALTALPGGVTGVAARKAVQAAKTFAENAQGAASFTNWVDTSCGLSTIKFDPEAIFKGLVNAPDSIAGSAGCFQKKKGVCKKLEPKPDRHKDKPKDKPDDKDKDKPDDKDKPASKTSQTAESTATPTPTSAGCAFCNGEDEKRKKGPRDVSRYSRMFSRANAGSPPPGKDKNKGKGSDGQMCILPGPDDIGGCAPGEMAGLLPRALGYLAAPVLASVGLEPRSLSIKDLKIKLGKDQWDLDVGKYPPCGDAVDRKDIVKYIRYKDDPNFCSFAVERVNKAKSAGVKYETDHVFEAQTLSRFFMWLGDQTTAQPVKPGSKHMKPTQKWVGDILLGSDKDPTSYKLESPILGTPAGGDFVSDIMGVGFGRSDDSAPSRARGEANLALIERQMNGVKGVWFSGYNPRTPFTNNSNQADARDLIRRGSGMFAYLAFRDAGTSPAEPDTIWAKWMRVSNWIYLVCDEFDKRYLWGTTPGEPKGPGGRKGSLKAMYAYWIDNELKSIEDRAAKWAEANKKKFDTAFPKLTGAEKKWRDAAFGPNGIVTAQSMKFPRSPQKGKASVYGAYCEEDYTFDFQGNKKKLRAPARV